MAKRDSEKTVIEVTPKPTDYFGALLGAVVTAGTSLVVHDGSSPGYDAKITHPDGTVTTGSGATKEEAIAKAQGQ